MSLHQSANGWYCQEYLRTEYKKTEIHQIKNAVSDGLLLSNKRNKTNVTRKSTMRRRHEEGSGSGGGGGMMSTWQQRPPPRASWRYR